MTKCPGKYSMIALICAVQAEAGLLLEETVVSSTMALGSKTVIEGALHNQHILLCVGGMGKVNASHAATLLFTRFHPKAVVVFGVGGAYPASGAKVGDIALAREEIAGDEGVLTREGFKDMKYIRIPRNKTGKIAIFSTYPASGPLVRRSLQLLTSRQGAGDQGIHAGTFVTLSTCTGTAERARELETRYHGLCENMEGAAVAQVAGLHGIPWLEVRGISNLVEDRDLRKWDIPRAAEAAQTAVLRILEGWNG